MKILVVDDNARASERIRGSLSASQDVEFLEISDANLVHRLIDFGIEFDVALIDLRFADLASSDEHYDGLAVCQKISQKMPQVVIVGYSSSFSVKTEQNQQLKDRFQSMGADIVCALDHLTLTPVNELLQEFSSARSGVGHTPITGPRQPLGGDRLKDKPATSAGQRDVGAPTTARKSRVFIGSSQEGLEVARRIQAELAHDFVSEVWNQTPFGMSDMTIEALERAIKQFQFAIFVFTPDDERTSRGQEELVPRDNVIFEVGLFVGSLGRSHTFVVKQRERRMALPSDLAGLTTAEFDMDADNLAAALGPVCQKIRDAVKSAQRK